MAISKIGTNSLGNVTDVSSSTTLSLKTADTTRMTIDVNGNVGIGTSSPSSYGKLAIGLAATGSATNNILGIYQSASVDAAALRIAGFRYTGTAQTAIDFIQNSASNFQSQIAFSTDSGGGIAERMRIDSSGNVGIGVSNPTSRLHVSGTANITGNGYFGGQLNAANSGSTFDYGINLNAAGNGYIAGTNQDNATSTDTNVKIASWFGLGFASAISGQAVPYGQNAGWINCRTGAMQIRGALTQNASDRRLKENLEVIPNALEKIASISGYTFDWKMDKCFDLGFKPAKEHEHGVIAQEIKEVIPDAVSLAPFDTGGENEGTSFSRSGEEYLTVHIEKLIPLLLQGIKEQQELIKQLQADVAKLKGAKA